MDFKYIRLIAAIVECGSLSKAAEMLNLTQSALSHQLKEIESRQNTRFFTRSNRTLKLTPAGKIVYQSARNILSEIETLDMQLKNMDNSGVGTIRVNAACSTSYHWLPQVLESFRQDYPNVEVNIVVDPGCDTIQALLDSRIDVAIMITPQANPNISYTHLFDDEMVAVFAHGHPFENRKYVVAKDFAEQQLFIYSFPLETVVFYQQILKPKGVEPRKITALPLTEATIEMIRAGYGVSVMSKRSVLPYLESGRVACCRINRNGFFRSHYAAVLSNCRHPEFLDRFIFYLK